MQKTGLTGPSDAAVNSKIGIKSRPPYVHQAPLSFIPGCGPKFIEKLLAAFGSEMKVIHEVAEEELSKVVTDRLAKKIIQARAGKMEIQEGGGGRYGKIK